MNDNEALLTKDWMQFMGFGECEIATMAIQLDEDPEDTDCMWRVIVWSGNYLSLANINDPDRCWMRLCEVANRGDVRRVLDALKIERPTTGEPAKGA